MYFCAVLTVISEACQYRVAGRVSVAWRLLLENTTLSTEVMQFALGLTPGVVNEASEASLAAL